MRRLGRSLLLAALLAASTGRAAAQEVGSDAPAAKRPNLVVFLADDLGLTDTGAYGNPDVRTPNIDRLARDGVTFERAFVASPACAPSRAALLTGLMPARNGAEANQSAPYRWVKPLPAYLHALGYQVAAFGKVAHYRQTGRYGFDHFAHDGFHDDGGTDAAIAWLKARRDPRPLAIFIGSNWPHVPWPKTRDGYDPVRLTLPPRSVDTPITRDARARYYAAVSRLDAELGKVITASDQVLGRDAVVLFSSDHGAQWPFGKWNLYDTGIQVPMVVRWSGTVRPGTHAGAMVSWTDILPTLVELGGGAAPADIDGRSFAPLLRDPAATHRDVVFTTHSNDGNVNVFPMRSVRTERWKYIRNWHPDWTYTTHIDLWAGRLDSGGYFPSWRSAAIRDGAAAAIVDAYYRRPAEELYDLAADPAETRNLAAYPRHRATLTALAARLEAWQRVQGDTMRLDAAPRLARGPLGGLPEPQSAPTTSPPTR